MKGANYLEKLLDNQPVEWKKLGEIGIFQRGTSFQKKHFTDEGIPCIHYGQIYTRYNLSADKTISFLSPEFASRARKAQSGDLIIATTSENDEDVCKAIAWEGQEEVVVSNDACFYHHTMHPRYVAYFFQTEQFQKQKRSYITGTKVRRVNANDLARIEIPIPPLSVQSRIVEILDKFTSLEAELEAELELRKKQYAYYREQLLNFSYTPPSEFNVVYRKLGEVADYEQPTAYLVKDTKYKEDYPTPVLTAGKTFILGYTNETEGIYEASKHPTIIFDDFTTALRWVDFDFKAKSSAMKMITSKDENVCLLKYIYYWLCTVPSEVVVGDHKRQWISNYANKDFPLPPLSEQERIVEILDKFDTLTNSISEGLPLEIQLRRQQYEYYREQLLAFPYA
ncbi:MAG: restriction endonuclease subunit S [Alloprevotella sp.]|nr:restriction endonuclease subunit S [Alloprevotella sp.]